MGEIKFFFSGQKTTNLEIHTPGQSESDKDTQTVKVFPESTVFFYERFCSAFPGVRGIHWFNDADEAIARLSRLLQPPLSLIKDNHNGCLSPIWWWRGGNLHIQKFRKMDGSIVLLDWNELKIEKIAAVNPGSYYQCFVYVQAAQMEPIGLYPRTEEQLAGCLETFGYCSEEYGLLENKHIVSRAEYDDGAAMINGQLTDFNGEIELRVRYVTPYNFIIAAQDCPINNLRFDQKLEELMNDLLVKKVSLEQVVKIISQLPKREHRG